MSRGSDIEKSWQANATAWIDTLQRGAIESRRLGTDGHHPARAFRLFSRPVE